jgi:hypothetical protein
MDPNIIRALSDIIGPVFALLVVGAIPVSVIFLRNNFKLRMRELDLEAELHGRESQARLQAMETRLAAMEGALGSLVQAISARPDFLQANLMQPPDAPHLSEPEAPRLPSLTQIK